MNVFSQKIATNKQEEIKDFILNNFDASISPKQYTFWEIKNKDFSAAFYNSGKFVVQGKNITPVLEALSSKFNEISKEQTGCSKKDSKAKSSNHPSCGIDAPCYIGTDESGKGDFFGPLVIAGVMVDETNKKLFEEWGVKDSKKLKDPEIMKLAEKIKENSICSIVAISNIRYNELYVSFKNLNKLLAWGHARAIENILEKTDCKHALSDKFGDESLIINALMQKGKTITLEQKVRAETDIAVAAASVLARANFVQRMDDMASYYGMKFPKGCNDQVKEAARAFAKQFGVKRLSEVCKAHFKTLHEL